MPSVLLGRLRFLSPDSPRAKNDDNNGLSRGGREGKGNRRGYVNMFYGARRPGSPGAPLRLEAGQSLGDLKFELMPSAVIAGTVRDSDGEPLENAQVTLGRFTYEYGTARVEGV